MTHAAAVLFDVDGTLVDSNYLHVDAWQRAFQTMDLDVEAWRIHRAIGQDSDILIGCLAGSRSVDWQERVKQLHGEYYAGTQAQLRPLPHARELLHAVNDSDVRVVLATSAPEDELEVLRKVLDADDAIFATTSADDVDSAKPAPDIVHAALAKADSTAELATFIGDSVWDMVAARRAGVAPYAVRCGGIDDDALVAAGARAVFDDPGDLLRLWRKAGQSLIA